MLKPATVGGGVTVIGPHPAFTVGAGGASGNITTLTVLLALHPVGPAVPAGRLPQPASKT